MNLPKTHNIMSWIVFATVFFVLSIGGIEPAAAFNPQPEPPRFIMPTLNPDDSLRMNIAYVEKEKGKSARCVIYIRSLIDGAILVEEEISLEPGKGRSLDYSYQEFLQSPNYDPAQLDENEDFPLRVQIKTTSRKRIFVGLEIHGAITQTRTYIPAGAEPLK